MQFFHWDTMVVHYNRRIEIEPSIEDIQIHLDRENEDHDLHNRLSHLIEGIGGEF